MSIPNFIPTVNTKELPTEWQMDHQHMVTDTSLDQEDVLRTLFRFLCSKEKRTGLFQDQHINYCIRGLRTLPSGYSSLDASKSWICYWTLQSLFMLGHEFSSDIKTRAVNTISRFQNKTGGFGGGPGQVSHLAATYSSIHALALIGDEAALSLIDRKTLYDWFLSLKQSDGSFRMSIGGEIDIRASYCVVACASLLNLLTEELTTGMAEFIVKCQGFDGGLGCYPGVESHGGYTYCGLAALALLGEVEKFNIPHLISWAVQRQLHPEGGFQGRTNKLVDGCYTFWVGAIFPILANFAPKVKQAIPELYSREYLTSYVLNACQSMSGGLRDKPGKSPDAYHTAYVLSGLSIAQYIYYFDKEKASQFQSSGQLGLNGYHWSSSLHPLYQAGSQFQYEFILTPTHPLFNIPFEKVINMYQYFYDCLK